MGYPTKVQLIQRKASEQWYVNFPSAVAQAMDFQKGETVEWIVEAKDLLVLRRTAPPPSVLKKKARPRASSPTSSGSSGAPAGPSPKSGSSGAP
jgi:hypothetical protein